MDIKKIGLVRQSPGVEDGGVVSEKTNLPLLTVRAEVPVSLTDLSESRKRWQIFIGAITDWIFVQKGKPEVRESERLKPRFKNLVADILAGKGINRQFDGAKLSVFQAIAGHLSKFVPPDDLKVTGIFGGRDALTITPEIRRLRNGSHFLTRKDNQPDIRKVVAPKMSHLPPRFRMSNFRNFSGVVRILNSLHREEKRTVTPNS